MDRVRIGLTGLGVVFLLTLGVSFLFGPADAPQPVIEAEKEPGEPLAQLGVTPSNDKLQQAPSGSVDSVPATGVNPDGQVDDKVVFENQGASVGAPSRPISEALIRPADKPVSI